ncbi:hypothetical protein [Melioribacter sp. OK-6-Me]|uniref:hypothetical protein n=1 Tax=unclassified Melioribacter TaxID=2627329 RepID=UPI003ED983A9
MKDSKLEAEKICNYIEDLSKGKLHFKEDIYRLAELSIKSDKLELLEQLSFHAKFSRGIISIIQRKDEHLENEYLQTIEKEYLDTIIKIRELLVSILSNATDFLRTIFEEKYLQLTYESMNNLKFLCEDLSFLKLYFNDMKYGK